MREQGLFVRQLLGGLLRVPILFLIAWLLTGTPLIAGGIAGLEIITKTILYYFHERQWNRVRWGKLPNERATASWYRALFRASYRIRRKLNGEKKTNRKRPRAN